MLTYDRLNQLLAPHDVGEYTNSRMFGRRCLSVHTRPRQTAIELLAEVVVHCEGTAEAAYLLRHAMTDEVGPETIIYWPAIRPFQLDDWN